MPKTDSDPNSHASLKMRLQSAWNNPKFHQLLSEEDERFEQEFPRHRELLSGLMRYAKYMSQCIEQEDKEAYSGRAYYLGEDLLKDIRRATKQVELLMKKRGFLCLGETIKVIKKPEDIIGAEIKLTEKGIKRVSSWASMSKHPLKITCSDWSKTTAFRVTIEVKEGAKIVDSCPRMVSIYGMMPGVDFVLENGNLLEE